ERQTYSSALKDITRTMPAAHVKIVRSTSRVCFFFFQAEDGIRDFHVTGVQTCALPISTRLERSRSSACTTYSPWSESTATPPTRSEERRVGKECRSRWPPYR